MFTLPNLFSTPNVEAAQRDPNSNQLPSQYNGFGGGFLPDLANRMSQGAAQGVQQMNNVGTQLQANPTPSGIRQAFMNSAQQAVGGMSQALLAQAGQKPSQQYYSQLMQAQNSTPKYTQPGTPTPAFAPTDTSKAQASIPSAFERQNGPMNYNYSPANDLNVPYQSATQQAIARSAESPAPAASASSDPYGELRQALGNTAQQDVFGSKAWFGSTGSQAQAPTVGSNTMA